MVQHLARLSSDHVPLLITLKSSDNGGPKYFKFLDLWSKHENFKKVVQEVWKEPVDGNAMWKLYQKLKRTCQKLSTWSREVFGDIYEERKRLEKHIAELEKELYLDHSAEKRAELNKCKANYLQFLKLQEAVLRQKAKANWLKDGDRNAAYFYNTIKGRRKRLNIQRIQDANGKWIEGSQEIADAAIEHFQRIFSHHSASNNFSALDNITTRIIEDDTFMLIAVPDLEEVKQAVFSFSA
ncbi:uncharacterized protein [Nicotiana sylvestris]|uniref:uncharacterized protein n=1 Tax=Nicotiana sylvestris TaxID=4096 RepID=UPI00388C3B50